MIYSVVDIEANGLLYATPKAKAATKIHCLCYARYDNTKLLEKGILTQTKEIVEFLIDEKIIVGHNIIRYDVPLLEKLLGVKITASLIDTLGLSWYLYPKRTIHGLEEWGKDFGVDKPPVVDWDNAHPIVYTFRCSEDVRINSALFSAQVAYLETLYEGNNILRLMMYLSYKLMCAREAENTRWKLDVLKCNVNLVELQAKLDDKKSELGTVMPVVVDYKMVNKPDGRYYKKDGTISKAGEKWEEVLLREGLPLHHTESVRVEASRTPGNPNSTEQLKEWLDNMGWKPETFKYVKEFVDGRPVNRAIPQIMADDDSGVCGSIKKMFPKYPFLAHLEEYSVLKHRIGLLKGFLRDVDEHGYLRAEIRGFTNTLRFQHKTIVNLPQMPKKYWDKIRECLIAPSDKHELCGADMTSLENNTKHHYMYFFDPEGVRKMRTEDYDPHLDLAVSAKLITEQQSNEHKLYDRTKGEKGKSHKAIRLKAKKSNYALVYGAGPAKLSVTINIPLKESTTLHTAYWKINHSVKKVANSCKVKVVNGQKWLYNPVSRFWLSLREEKDRFSTLNQSTGVFCFDTWVSHVREAGVRLCGQFHDEIIFPISKDIGGRQHVTAILDDAIIKTNALLKLNVPLGISIQFGNNYAEIH